MHTHEFLTKKKLEVIEAALAEKDEEIARLKNILCSVDKDHAIEKLCRENTKLQADLNQVVGEAVWAMEGLLQVLPVTAVEARARAGYFLRARQARQKEGL